MQRRTFRRIKAASSAGHHHNVYVVLLAPEAADLPEVCAANPRRKPKKPRVYVGMTGLSPEERFANHKNGIKAARVVQRYGVRLLPELYEVFNPMPFEAALEMERELAEDLRAQGYTVTGGH
jgi:predicted GIY-YIG superfamily endonuclease